MMRALAIVCCLVASPACAQTCAPIEKALEIISQAVPITRVVTLDAEQTAGVLVWWNDQPPESNDAYDLAVVIAHPGGRMGLLMGKAGEVCASLALTKEMIPSLMEAISNPQKPRNPV